MEKIKTHLIQIGNSQGIRIPKYILDRLNLQDKLELLVDEETNQIHIKSADIPRQNWEEKFKKMHETGEDTLIFDEMLDSNENNDWEW